MAGKNDNRDNDSTRLLPIVVAVIGAFVGGSGGTLVVVGSGVAEDILRPDKYTGTQATVLEGRLASLSARVDDLERRIDANERRVDQLPPRDLEYKVRDTHRRIEILEEDVRKLEKEAK